RTMNRSARRLAKSILFLSMGSALVFSAASSAQAQFSKPLRIVTVLPAGNDGYVRAVASKLGDQVGQPVIVDNRPGAGGVTAAQSVSTAAPDGHSMMIIASAFLIAKAVNPKLAYEPLEDFSPVAKIYGGSSSMLVVRPESPAKSLE